MKSVGKFLKSQAILCLLALFIVFLAISRPSFVSPTNIKNVLMVHPFTESPQWP